MISRLGRLGGPGSGQEPLVGRGHLLPVDLEAEVRAAGPERGDPGRARAAKRIKHDDIRAGPAVRADASPGKFLGETRIVLSPADPLAAGKEINGLVLAMRPPAPPFRHGVFLPPDNLTAKQPARVG